MYLILNIIRNIILVNSCFVISVRDVGCKIRTQENFYCIYKPIAYCKRPSAASVSQTAAQVIVNPLAAKILTQCGKLFVQWLDKHGMFPYNVYDLSLQYYVFCGNNMNLNCSSCLLFEYAVNIQPLNNLAIRIIIFLSK